MDELGPLFEAPQEPDRLGALVALLAALTLAGAVLALVRGRLPGSLAYPGLMLVPLFAYLLGSLNLLEQSKRVEFCGSCHEPMSPLVEAMQRDTQTLASVHYRNGAVPRDAACYRCHSGYGLWGDAEAKAAGVMHMLKMATSSFEYPIRKRGRFDIAACLDCHAQAAPFRQQEVHRDPEIQRALLAGEMGCAGLCHAAPHPPEALSGAAAWKASR